MNIAIACGGTGGHLYPGAATGEALRRRGHDVALWLTGRDAESGIDSVWDGRALHIPARGIGPGPAGRLTGIVSICGSILKSWVAMRRERPSALLAMGSYACVGPVVAARLCGVPVVLHEANAKAGKANAALARIARTVCVAFDGLRGDFSGTPTVVTGFPLRSFPESGRDARAEKEGDVLHVLVMGGSQGAQVLNDTVPAALGLAINAQVELQVTHLTGRGKRGQVERQYAENAVPHVVDEYSDQMHQLYAEADLAIGRAGAGTCTELSRFGIPAILVPHPTAGGAHQVCNAKSVAQGGGAICLEQHDLSPDALAQHVIELGRSPARLASMSENIQSFAGLDAADKVADVILRHARND